MHSGIDFAVNYTVYVIHFSQNLAKISFFRCNIFNSIRVSDRPMISYDVIYLGHSLCIRTQHRDLEVYRMSSLLVLKHKPLFNCICHVFPQFFAWTWIVHVFRLLNRLCCFVHPKELNVNPKQAKWPRYCLSSSTITVRSGMCRTLTDLRFGWDYHPWTSLADALAFASC